MSYGPAESLDPPRNRHAWEAFVALGPSAERCIHCFVARTTTTPVRWRDHRGDWHTSPIPRCGEAR